MLAQSCSSLPSLVRRLPASVALVGDAPIDGEPAVAAASVAGAGGVSASAAAAAAMGAPAVCDGAAEPTGVLGAGVGVEPAEAAAWDCKICDPGIESLATERYHAKQQSLR